MPLQVSYYQVFAKVVFKRCLTGLQKGVSKGLKGHLLQAKWALIGSQLSLNKKRRREKY